MLGNSSNNFLDYYLEMQQIFGFKYLPENRVVTQKNGTIRPAEIDVPTHFAPDGKTLYNVRFLDNGTEYCIDMPEAEILGTIPLQLTLPI